MLCGSLFKKCLEPVQRVLTDSGLSKSEIDDIRKSVVSMSVGQPGKTSTIVQEWLEQPAPAPEAGHHALLGREARAEHRGGVAGQD